MKSKLITALFHLLLLSTTVHAEGIPTFDVANSVNMAKSLANDAQKIKALADQVAYWKQQMAMISGSRGMGVLAAAGAVKGIPASWDTILQQVQTASGAYGDITRAVGAVTGNNTDALTPSQLDKMTAEQRALIVRSRNLGATQKVIADMTLNVAGKQMQEIQVLNSKIDTATDPKAIADLNAAMQGKQLELENTRLKILAMDQQRQAEQYGIEQQQHEIALKMLDTSQPSRVRF